MYKRQVVDGLDQCFAAGRDVGGGQVADDQDLRVGTGNATQVNTIVAAVDTALLEYGLVGGSFRRGGAG